MHSFYQKDTSKDIGQSHEEISSKQKKQSVANIGKEEYEMLQQARIVQKELVYVIGLSPRIANKTVRTKQFILNSY